MNIPLSSRPVCRYICGRWTVAKARILLKGRSVEMGRVLFDCDDLTAIVGCAAFGYEHAGQILVFDFSASHLCPNQLERILRFYEHAD